MDAFIGQIEAFAFAVCPKGWAPCDGRLLEIRQNQVLFSLIGTTFGGNGRTTFGLPDLRGRAVIGANGSAANGPLCEPGQSMGSEHHVLVLPELPVHDHPPPNAHVTVIMDRFERKLPLADAPPDAEMDSAAMESVGQGEPHDNMMPSFGVNYCICIEGLLPPRD